jgi:hypothetical protein
MPSPPDPKLRTRPVPTFSDRWLVLTVSRAIACHAGRPEPSIADRRLVARLFCGPGAPLERFDACQFERMNGFDAHAIIG